MAFLGILSKEYQYLVGFAVLVSTFPLTLVYQQSYLLSFPQRLRPLISLFFLFCGYCLHNTPLLVVVCVIPTILSAAQLIASILVSLFIDGDLTLSVFLLLKGLG